MPSAARASRRTSPGTVARISVHEPSAIAPADDPASAARAATLDDRVPRRRPLEDPRHAARIAAGEVEQRPALGRCDVSARDASVRVRSRSSVTSSPSLANQPRAVATATSGCSRAAVAMTYAGPP